MQIVGNVTGFALGSFAAIAGNLPLALVAVALIELVGEQREALAVEQRIDRVGCDPAGGTEDVGLAGAMSEQRLLHLLTPSWMQGLPHERSFSRGEPSISLRRNAPDC
jgi:hypothetical protein